MDKATEKALERVRRADDGWPDGGAVNVCARDLRPILAAAEESEKLRAALRELVRVHTGPKLNDEGPSYRAVMAARRALGEK